MQFADPEAPPPSPQLPACPCIVKIAQGLQGGGNALMQE